MPTKKEVEDHFTSHDHPNYKHTVTEKKKYFVVQQGSAGDIARGYGGSVKLFVDKDTGEAWNSASAKAPNKKQPSYASFRDAVPHPVSPYRMRYRSSSDMSSDTQDLERAHEEAVARRDKGYQEGAPVEVIERSAAEAAHYEKKLADIRSGEKAAASTAARTGLDIGAMGEEEHWRDKDEEKASRDAALAKHNETNPLVKAYATSGGMGHEAAKAQVEIEDLEKKFDAYRVSAKNLRIEAGKHDEQARAARKTALEMESPSHSNKAQKHELSAKNLRNAADTEEGNARAVTQQILTKKTNLATVSRTGYPHLDKQLASSDARKANEPAPARGAVTLDTRTAQLKTQSGFPVDVAHFSDRGGPLSDWDDLNKQDHADMAVGLENKLEELHDQAAGLDKVGLSAHSVRDEIEAHEKAIAAHTEAAYGKPTSTQLELPTNARVAAPPAAPKELAPRQEDRTAAVGAGLHPRDQKLVDFAHRAPTTAPKDIRNMGAERVAKFAQQHIETGLKGGQFYRSGSGSKIYVK